MIIMTSKLNGFWQQNSESDVILSQSITYLTGWEALFHEMDKLRERSLTNQYYYYYTAH